MFIYFIFRSHIFQNGTSEMTGMLECSTIGPNWNGDRNRIYGYDIICHLFHWSWWICMWRVHYIWDGFGTIYFVDCEWQHIIPLMIRSCLQLSSESTRQRAACFGLDDHMDSLWRAAIQRLQCDITTEQ